MHLVNEVLTLIPTNGSMVTTGVTSPTKVPQTALNGITTAINGAATSMGIPSNLNCLSVNAITALNALNAHGVPPPVNAGFQTAVSGVPTNVNGVQVTTVNGVPTSPLNGLTVNSTNGLTTPTPAPLSPTQSMELVWHGEFDRLFAQYFPHMWCLVPTFCPPGDGWRTFKDSAKVRFSCQECGHGWTSMKGRVVFWFELNYSNNAGCVMFKLYGQQCQKCKNGRFEHAMWYPEEVVKVIGNVYNRVGQIYYGFVRPPLRIDRRIGKPRNQHNAELCQACKEGLCREEWSFS